MEHFVKLIPEDVRSKLDFENMKNSHQLHQAVPKQFLLKDLEGLKINKFFEVNHIFTFSFVRHPFDRLVSAYLDKIGKLFFPSVLPTFYSTTRVGNTVLHVIFCTDMGSLIGNTQGGNFIIFLQFRFYVKSILSF